MSSNDYSAWQQPVGGYGDADEGDAFNGYGAVQNPASPYGATPPPSPSGNAVQNPPAASGQTATTPPTTQVPQPAPDRQAALKARLGNGVNLQPSYEFGGNVDLGWKLMRKSKDKIKSVRIEIEADPKDLTRPNANAPRWIKEAVKEGYTVIATFHKWAMLDPKTNTTDDPNELLYAANWWVANFQDLSKAGPFTINFMNEWGDANIAPHDFAQTYNQAIAIVRPVYKGPIIVDIPGSGQATHTAYLAIRGTSNATITDPNIILSAHIYPDAYNPYTRRGVTTDDLEELAKTNLPCMIGEFGDNGKTGKDAPTNWSGLVQYAKDKMSWPVFGWAWNGDGDPDNMNMIKPKTPKTTQSSTGQTDRFLQFVAGKDQDYVPNMANKYFQQIIDLL